MSYSYQTERPWLFSEAGVAAILRVRATIQRHLKTAGAVRSLEATKDSRAGSSWSDQAILDYLVERKELREVTPPGTWGQYRVFCEPIRD